MIAGGTDRACKNLQVEQHRPPRGRCCVPVSVLNLQQFSALQCEFILSHCCTAGSTAELLYCTACSLFCSRYNSCDLHCTPTCLCGCFLRFGFAGILQGFSRLIGRHSCSMWRAVVHFMLPSMLLIYVLSLCVAVLAGM